MKLALHVHDACYDDLPCDWSSEGVLSLHDVYETLSYPVVPIFPYCEVRTAL